MIDLGTAIRHYKRPEIQEEIILAAENKEAVARFGDSFGQRPDILSYPRDVLQLAQKGATSFHASEELWSYPLRLSPMMSRAEADELRVGWDLVLDIDCALLEYSKIAADEVVKKLAEHRISAISVKFSGNKGFHIGVPFESFPEKIGGKDAQFVFPEAARIVAAYIKEGIKSNVKERLLGMEKSITEIIRKTGKQPSEEARIKTTDTEKQANDKVSRYIESFLNIDTVLISSRHLYRMPYSLHEKSGLVSLPIKPDAIMKLEKQDAKPENVSVSKFRFLDRSCAVKGEAQELFDQAYYLHLQTTTPKQETSARQYSDSGIDFSEGAVQQQYWPPCMHRIMEGLEDGRKRALLILINFMSSTGWDYKDIERTVNDWNKKNKPPLGEPYVHGQLEYYRHKGKRILPPNCSNPGYYSDMQIKCSEEICSRCKNPVVFAKRRNPNKKQPL